MQELLKHDTDFHGRYTEWLAGYQLTSGNLDAFEKTLKAARSRQDKRLFARAERWRDRLCNDGNDAVAEFIAATDSDNTDSDNKELLQLVANLASASNEQIARKLRRQIFRLVHDLLAAQPQDV